MSNTKYYAQISGTVLDKVRSLTVEKNLSQYSGKFSLSVSDPENTYYNEFTSGDEIEVIRDSDSEKVFGGFVENVQRDKDNRYILNIDGGDYTTKLNNIIVLGEVYNGREYSVIVRDLMHKYVMDTSLIDNCEVTTDWTATNGTLTLETGTDADDYLISRLGDACLKLVPTSATGTLYKTMAYAFNYAATDYVVVYFYIQDATKLNSLSLDLGQDSSNYYNIAAPKQTLSNGWNYLEFDLSTRTTGTGTPSLSAIDYFRLNFDLDDTTNVMYIDDFRRVPHTVDDYTLTNVQTTHDTNTYKSYYVDIKFKNVTVFDAIRKIKDIRPNTYDFYVDNDKILNFGSFGEIDSGEVLQRGVNVLKSEFWDDDDKLCNKVTVYGGRQKFNWTNTFDGDGSIKEFQIEYTPITQDVYVGTSLKKGYVTGMSPTEYDYRVDTDNRKIIFNSAPTTGTDNVIINYTYGVPIIVQRQDDDSITNYCLREQKIENEFLLKKEDAQVVAVDYIESWKNPILNAKYSVRINPDIDIGERVGVVDERYFGDSLQRDFGVVSLKNTFIGGKMATELNLTQISKSVEMYLQEIFTRLNALEEAEKSDSDVLRRLLSFSDTIGTEDDPENNLSIQARSIAGENGIWDNQFFGIWDTSKWSSGTYETSFILGNSLAAILGSSKLGSVTSDWGDNLVVNPSD